MTGKYARSGAWIKGLSLLGTVCACGFLAGHVEAGKGQSQADMNMQAGRDFQKADAELNRTYRKLVRTLEPGPKAKLKTAQSAWIKFRDAEADFRASQIEGGSMYPMIHSGTLADLTRHRTIELKDSIKAFGPQ